MRRLLLAAAVPLALASCAVAPGYGPDYDVGAGYYEPYGGYYGGYGDGFLLGPYGDFDHRIDRGWGGFRSPVGFRGPGGGFRGGIPSIPGGFHGGGFHGGGFHGGGFGGGFHGGGFHGGGFHGGGGHR